jgi:tripartite-type tricarboxylate transporter receptor subunit TctC
VDEAFELVNEKLRLMVKFSEDLAQLSEAWVEREQAKGRPERELTLGQFLGESGLKRDWLRMIGYMLAPIEVVGPLVRAGTVKAYAIASAERDSAMPNVPTPKEAGLPDFQASPRSALFAPKGVPQPILDRLADALDKALDDDSVRKRLLDIGDDIPGDANRGQPPLAAVVKSEIARWPAFRNASVN